MQVKHLLNVNILYIIWSSFLCSTLSKLVTYTIYFTGFGTDFSYFFLLVTRGNFIKKYPFKYVFAKFRWKWKENSTGVFLSYQKRISPVYFFKILQVSANYFRVRRKEEKQQYYKKLKHIKYFNIINIAGCWCTSESSVIN